MSHKKNRRKYNGTYSCVVIISLLQNRKKSKMESLFVVWEQKCSNFLSICWNGKTTHNSVKFVKRSMVEGIGPSRDVPCICLTKPGNSSGKEKGTWELYKISFLSNKEMVTDEAKNKDSQFTKVGPVSNKTRYLSRYSVPIYPTAENFWSDFRIYETQKVKKKKKRNWEKEHLCHIKRLTNQLGSLVGQMFLVLFL